MRHWFLSSEGISLLLKDHIQQSRHGEAKWKRKESEEDTGRPPKIHQVNHLTVGSSNFELLGHCTIS